MAKQNETKKKSTNLTAENVVKKIVEKQKEASVIIGSLTSKEEVNIAKIVAAPYQKSILEEKIDEIISLLQKLVNADNTKLSNMSLTDLAALKETLNHEISSNRYPGGDTNIIIRGQNLILKINAEITNRINLYN